MDFKKDTLGKTCRLLHMLLHKVIKKKAEYKWTHSMAKGCRVKLMNGMSKVHKCTRL